jgi:hypothetical protein
MGRENREREKEGMGIENKERGLNEKFNPDQNFNKICLLVGNKFL